MLPEATPYNAGPIRSRTGHLVGVQISRNGELVAYALADEGPGFIVYSAQDGQPLRYLRRLRQLRQFYTNEQLP